MSCGTCGQSVTKCCIGLRVPVTRQDVARLGYVSDALWNTDLPGAIAEMPRREDGRCLFLTDEGQCAIYRTRPQACRDQDPGVCRTL